MKRILLFLLLAGGLGTLARAEVNVNINVGVPAVKVSADPEMTVIPGTYIYFITESPDDIFFYQGYWWRPYQGRWHRARGFNGPWVFMKPGRVPPGMLRLPSDWRKLPPGHPVIRHSQVRSNWKKWEKERHWDNHNGGRPSGMQEKQGRVKGSKKGRQ
jgi:hypothetical protein